MKKIFKTNKITWKNLLIFSVLIGILVGIIDRIPILKNTSFQDIGVTLDVWIIFAIIIIYNSKSIKEAILKTFTFFLISQPLIYATQSVIDAITTKKSFIDLFMNCINQYYIGGSRWGLWTILTIPGSAIAYQIKKDNILSSIILSVVTCYYGYEAIYNGLLGYHYISCIFCLTMAFLLIFTILSKKKERIISITLTILSMLAGILMYNKTINTPVMGSTSLENEENIHFIEVTVINNSYIVDAYINEDDDTDVTIITGTKVGETLITLKDTEDRYHEYKVISTYKGLEIKLNKVYQYK